MSRGSELPPGVPSRLCVSSAPQPSEHRRGDSPGRQHTPEAGGQVHGHVLVALLKAVVLADVVQVIAADDDGALHLHLGHHTCTQGTAHLRHLRGWGDPRGPAGTGVPPGSNTHRFQGFLLIYWPLTARPQPPRFCYKPNYSSFLSPSKALPNAPHTTSSHPTPTPALQHTWSCHLHQ